MDDAVKKPEEMASFFDERVSGYDDDMRRFWSDEREDGSRRSTSFDQFYDQMMSAPIDQTHERIRVLDLGCGTGLELTGIFTKAPNALVTGIDVSEKMLARLKEKYVGHLDQLTLLKGSYVTLPFEEGAYDYAVSVMTMHHFLPDEKCRLYEKIRMALKPGGKYIEGDWFVSIEKEREYLEQYEKTVRLAGLQQDDLYHIDIPFSLETQTRLLLRAGFSKVEVIWEECEAAVLVAAAA